MTTSIVALLFNVDNGIIVVVAVSICAILLDQAYPHVVILGTMSPCPPPSRQYRKSLFPRIPFHFPPPGLTLTQP